jgi:C-terminal processing protease CtpA/Prc
VFTEALGDQRHHGQVAMLVNEHSASAAEMVAAFASEYRVAILVGVKTAGRLVATSAFKAGFGYRVVLPVAAYFTWQGTNLKGVGLVPNVEEPLSLRRCGTEGQPAEESRRLPEWCFIGSLNARDSRPSL